MPVSIRSAAPRAFRRRINSACMRSVVSIFLSFSVVGRLICQPTHMKTKGDTRVTCDKRTREAAFAHPIPRLKLIRCIRHQTIRHSSVVMDKQQVPACSQGYMDAWTHGYMERLHQTHRQELCPKKRPLWMGSHRASSNLK